METLASYLLYFLVQCEVDKDVGKHLHWSTGLKGLTPYLLKILVLASGIVKYSGFS